MKTFNWLLAAFLAAGAAPAAATPNPPRKPSATSEQNLEAAASALAELDSDRLLQDPEYARATLARIAIIEPKLKGDAEAQLGLDAVKMIALAVAGQAEEAATLARNATARAGDEPAIYSGSYVVALLTEKMPLALETLEAAAARLPRSRHAELREALNDEALRPLFSHFRGRTLTPERVRLAAAIVALGLPDPDDVAMLDLERVKLVDGRLAAKDLAGARSTAAAVTAPEALLRLLVLRKYDPLLGDEFDRDAAMAKAIAAYDRTSSDYLRAKPEDLRRILVRAQWLRATGREQDALALLSVHTADMKKVETAGNLALWLVNEAAYSLIALGRGDEAVALMNKLIALGVEKHPELINMMINQGAVLTSAGRAREGAAWSEKLFADHSRYASPYGLMWMWSNAVCGHAFAGNSGALAPWLARIEKQSADNEAAHMRALLCANDLDGAERLLIRRLEAPDPAEMLTALQDYSGGAYAAPNLKELDRRLSVVAARPAVQAAIARTGRILKLPLSRTYWGGV